MIDLKNPTHSYLFGFLQADGHLRRLSRNRGSLRVELESQDRWILERFAEIVSVYSSITTRRRSTNFKDKYASTIWSVYSLELRQILVSLGMPEGHKSADIAPPKVEFSRSDYYRGLIDGDGALGLTSKGYPFLTLTTDSKALACDYLEFISGIIGKVKVTSRNSRDRMSNIAVFKEDAQQLAAVTYYEGSLALPRKMEKAKQIAAWIRPAEMKKIDNRKHWTTEDDRFVLAHSISEATQTLGRSAKSISLRRWRLRNSATK